jgi:CBS domain-containing protein
MASTSGSFRTSRLSQARVADAMHPGVLTCSSGTPLRDAARLMVTHHVHSVVVGDAPALGARPTWRLLSSLDLVAASVDGRLDDRTVGEATTSAAVTIGADEPVAKAARLMLEHGTAHVLVLGNQTGRPAGVLSSLDIAGLAAWGEA